MTSRLITIVITASACATVASAVHCPAFDEGRQVGAIETFGLSEVSGMAVGRRNPGVLWAHNDKGDGPCVYALSTQGQDLGIYWLIDAVNEDWEDMAVGPGPANNVDYLYIGDIGDNEKERSCITIYRVPEPPVAFGAPPAYEMLAGVESIVLQYPDEPQDSEAMFVDPISMDIFILSKIKNGFGLYCATYPQSTASVTTMEDRGRFTWYGNVSAVDISALGDMILIRNDKCYGSLYPRPAGATVWDAFAGAPCNVPIQWEFNGEVIAIDAGGCGYYTCSEGDYAPIHYYAGDQGCYSSLCDFDKNGRVDFDDLSLFFQRWTQTDPACDLAPSGGDGAINWLDFASCVEYWLE